MASDKNTVILRALFFSGFIAFIGFVLSQTVGLGAGGFDSKEVLTQFNFYTVGGTFLIIVLLFLFGLLFWKKGNEYGDSVFYVSQGRYPSLSMFRNFTMFRMFLLSTIIFGMAGLFMVITGQKTFTGLRVLEHQFTPIGSIAYSALLIPVSENLGAAAIILLTLVLVIAGYLIIRKTKEDSLESQLDEIRKLKRNSDNMFFAGKISEEKHNELNKEYSLQLNDLRNKIGEVSTHLINAEELKEEAKARERAIRDLRKLKDKKLISLRQYNEEYEKLFSEETQLEKSSEQELKNLNQDKKLATKKTRELKAKTKNLTKAKAKTKK